MEKRVRVSIEEYRARIEHNRSISYAMTPTGKFVLLPSQHGRHDGLCVNPECDNSVNFTERPSGHCCYEHRNYICGHPACMKKAVSTPWGIRTHRWPSNIGLAHYEYSFLQSHRKTLYYDYREDYIRGALSQAKETDKPDLVYFIGAQGQNLVKIGVSKSPEERLAQLKTGSPFPLFLAGAVEGGYELEKSLHSQLSSYRRSGEWFELPALIKEVLTSKYGVTLTSS